ncbi:MAG: hypothetical protein CMJ19_24920 [Phycisphaeraceae bacterium]|nr:hypothetical protein [Phycisphaeraceae bacterium]
MVAHQAVAHAEIMYQWIESVRSQTMDQYLPGVQCDEAWLDLYRDHRKVTEAVAFIFEPEDMWPYQTKNVQQELDDSRFVSNWAKKQPEDFEAFIRDEFSPMNILQFLRIGIRLNHRRYKKQLEQLQEIAKGTIHELEDAEFDRRIQSSLGLHYYIRVALPCMCVYRKFPLTVLRMAKRECVRVEGRQSHEWLEKLIRLDPYIAGAKFVRDWVSQPGGESTLARRQKVADWATQGLDSGHELTRRKVKYWFGGYIWAIAQRFGQVLLPRPVKYGPGGPMTARQILDLFHAWAQDCAEVSGKKRLDVRDPDLADIQFETWRDGIKKYRSQWDHIISGGGGRNSG